MAQIGISTLYSVALASGAIASKVERTRSCGLSEVPAQATGETALVKPLKTMKTEITINGTGPGDLTDVAVGEIGTPTDAGVVRVEMGEVNDGRVSFTINSVAHGAMPSASTGGDAGAGSPTVATIEVLSVAYSLTKECRVSAEIDEALELTPAGIPGFRALYNKRINFSSSGKGDIPANVGIGATGSKHASITGGASVTTSLNDTQESRATNGWSVEAINFPAASAG